MDIDDLKQEWKNNNQQNKPAGYNLNELLMQKNDSPLIALQAKYKKQFVLLPAAAGILLLTNLSNPAMRENAIIWFTIPLLLLLTFIYYRNYVLVIKMQQSAESSVKQSMEHNLAMLKKNGNQQKLLLRIIMVLFIVIVETILYYNAAAEFHFWQMIGFPFRLAAYALMLTVQPYISAYFFKLNFGQHINRLQELLDQAV